MSTSKTVAKKNDHVLADDAGRTYSEDRENITHASTGDVSAQFILVLPETAKRWLELYNQMNRKPRERAGRTYLESMENEEWDSLNGDTIVFDSEGLLVDGQHRLGAIAMHGKATECLVVYGVKPEARSTKDDGVKRRFYDDLSMNGVVSAAVKDALLRKILTWDRVGGLGDYRNQRFSRSHLRLRWPEYRSEIDAVEEKTRRWYKRWPSSPTSMNFIYWLLVYRTKADPKLVDRFMSIVTIGSQDPEDDILIKLRDKLVTPIAVNSLGHKTYAPADQDIYWLIRGWNAWITRTSYRYTTPRDGFKNPYPVPVKADMVSVEGQ